MNAALIAEKAQRSAPGALGQMNQELDQTINRHAKPQIHKQSDVGMEGLMLGHRREVGLEAEINGVANNNGNQVFYPTP